MKKAFFRGLILALFLLGPAAVLVSMGQKGEEKDAGKKPVTPNEDTRKAEQNILVEITGRVRLVGSEPFTELVITGQNRDWFIEKSEEHKLRELQQQTVTVEGIQTVTSLRWASGLPAGDLYSLRDIRIIRIEN